jgi:hypothetical protein
MEGSIMRETELTALQNTKHYASNFLHVAQSVKNLMEDLSSAA